MKKQIQIQIFKYLDHHLSTETKAAMFAMGDSKVQELVEVVSDWVSCRESKIRDEDSYDIGDDFMSDLKKL